MIRFRAGLDGPDHPNRVHGVPSPSNQGSYSDERVALAPAAGAMRVCPGNVQRELAFSSVLSLHESSMDESSPFLRRASRTSEASGEQMGRPRLLKVQDTWKEGLESQHIGFHYCGNLYRFLGQEGEIDISIPLAAQCVGGLRP